MKKISVWVWVVGLNGLFNVIQAVIGNNSHPNLWRAAFGAQAVMTAVTMYYSDQIMAIATWMADTLTREE